MPAKKKTKRKPGKKNEKRKQKQSTATIRHVGTHTHPHIQTGGAIKKKKTNKRAIKKRIIIRTQQR